MKKLLLFAVVLALALCGCSGGGSEELTQYETLDAVADAIGYYPNTPFYIPGTSYTETYWIVDGDVVQVIYENDENTITYRMAKGEDRSIIGIDLAGYDETTVNSSKGFEVPVLGKGGELYAAQWSEDGKSFSVYFTDGATAEQFDEVIKGV